MKSKIVTSLCLTALIFVSSFTYAQKLPPFSFTGLDDKAFTYTQLKSDTYTIAIFYDPYCDHCAQQATWMAEKPELFKDVQMLWVTTEGKEPVTEFYNTHFKDSELEHIHMLMDKQFMFDAYFGYSEAPSIYIFDKNGKRIKSLNEETPAEEIREIINKKG